MFSKCVTRERQKIGHIACPSLIRRFIAKDQSSSACRPARCSRVHEWIGELSKTDPVVTFCLYGFHIGSETAETLRKPGFDSR